MRDKPSRRLCFFFFLSTLGHVALFVWGLPWLATLPQGRLHATPVHITVVTPDTASRTVPSDADIGLARPQPVGPPAAVPPSAPPPAPENPTRVRPTPPPPPNVARTTPPVAKPSPARSRPRKVRKHPAPRPTVQKPRPVAPFPPPLPLPSPPSKPLPASAPAPAEAPMNVEQRAASPAGIASAEHTEPRVNAPGNPAAVASPLPPQGLVPRFAYKPCPRYPYVARRRRVEGTVTLRFTVLPAGIIGDIQVAKSSGNTLLDNAAQKAVRQWRPLQNQEFGRDKTWIHVPFTFALTALNDRNGHDSHDTPSEKAVLNCDAVATP